MSDKTQKSAKKSAEKLIRQADRPISPHLQIYRWQWTMALSITHRVTGLCLAIGMAVVIIKIGALAFGGIEIFSYFVILALSPWFVLCKIFFIWSLIYHMLNGIRHMVWDTGSLLSLQHARASGYIVLLISLVAVAYYGIFLAF